jgi:hypothetical protein
MQENLWRRTSLLLDLENSACTARRLADQAIRHFVDHNDRLALHELSTNVPACSWQFLLAGAYILLSSTSGSEVMDLHF